MWITTAFSAAIARVRAEQSGQVHEVTLLDESDDGLDADAKPRFYRLLEAAGEHQTLVVTHAGTDVQLAQEVSVRDLGRTK